MIEIVAEFFWFFVLVVLTSILVFMGRIANTRTESALAYALATICSGIAIFNLVITIANDILLAIK